MKALSFVVNGLGRLLLLVACLALLGYVSNAAFDYTTTRWSGYCARVDSSAMLCLSKPSLPAAE